LDSGNALVFFYVVGAVEKIINDDDTDAKHVQAYHLSVTNRFAYTNLMHYHERVAVM